MQLEGVGYFKHVLPLLHPPHALFDPGVLPVIQHMPEESHVLRRAYPSPRMSLNM